MFVCFLISAISGLLFLFAPKGPRAGWYQFENLGRDDLRDIHFIFGILMILFGLIHFVLHWNWIVAMTKSIFKKM